MNADRIDTLAWEKGDGLLPAVVQNARDGRVLMLAFVDREALARCFETGKAVVFSRSRKRLWMKGETSGNTLTIVSIDTDCDRDTVLLRVAPAGPTCHLGTQSCFGPAMPFLGQLDAIIADRLERSPDGSYTASLAAGGVSAGAQKVGEEGVEFALAAVSESDERVANEAADVLFHLMLALRQRGLGLDDAVRVLQDRNAAQG